MHAQKSIEYTLAIEAEKKRWFRESFSFQRITSEDLLDFPEMKKGILRSYLLDHINHGD